MHISVKNVGLINQADIDVDGVSVIGGYNGTGKSTILKAAYSVLSPNYNLDEKIEEERIKSFHQTLIRTRYANHYIRNNIRVKKAWERIKESYIENESFSIDELEMILAALFEKNDYDSLYKRKEENISKERERLEKAYEDVLQILKRGDSVYKRFIFLKYANNIFRGNISSGSGTKDSEIRCEYNGREVLTTFRENDLKESKEDLDLNFPVWYMSTSNIIDRIIDDNSSVADWELRKALMREIDQDASFEIFNEIEDNNEKVEEILNDILHGSLRYNDSEGVLMYEDNVSHMTFEMSNVASGMKNLLIIQRMLKNGTLGKNNILLIDEPETNLHPDWQVKFARILVLLNKELDIKLLINSHSPYFMRAVEVAMADCGVKERGRFYVMQEDGKGRYITEEVTETTDKIYEMLYEPLNYL